MNWQKLFNEWKYVLLILAVVIIAVTVTLLVLQGNDEPEFSEDEVISLVRYELIDIELINIHDDISIETEYDGYGKWTGFAYGNCYDRYTEQSTWCRIIWFFYEDDMRVGITNVKIEP